MNAPIPTSAVMAEGTEISEAWVLRRGSQESDGPGALELSIIRLPKMGDNDVLAEPLFGCWEGNMGHAVARQPVDICRLRREKEAVIGNAGVVRILRVGANVTLCKPDDICLTVPIGTQDRYGHTVRVSGYDTPGTIGVLAKRVVWPESNVMPLPEGSKYELDRWAGFPIRYPTAWENWKMAFSVWKAQFDGNLPEKTFVWCWGGGTSLASASLARHSGCDATMVASHNSRFSEIEQMGIRGIDRRQFAALQFDAERYENDREYRIQHLQSSKAFLELVEQHTEGEGVSIFIDHLGTPMSRVTLRALGRMGIIATAGWKLGKEFAYDRPAACVSRHAFIHTHGCRRSEGSKAVAFAEEHGWLPPANPPVYDWLDVPRLAEEYARGEISSYFPVFKVNAT